MLVCVCKGVSDSKIKALMRAGARNVRDLMQKCHAGSDCGSCVMQMREMILESCSMEQDEAHTPPTTPPTFGA